MDIEQLKLILSLVQQTTGDVKEIAIWWLIFQMIEVVIRYLALSVIVFLFYKAAMHVFKNN